jgi:hypothetical protein
MFFVKKNLRFVDLLFDLMNSFLEKITRYLVEVTKLMFVAVAQARVRAIIEYTNNHQIMF